MSRLNLLALLLAVLLSAACDIENSRREVRTLANLQALALSLQDMLTSGEVVERADFESMVQKYFDQGKDPWGSLIVFIPGSENGQSDFLLISLGSDAALDVRDPKQYFELQEPPQPSKTTGRDIVMRGNRTISYGAHK